MATRTLGGWLAALIGLLLVVPSPGHGEPEVQVSRYQVLAGGQSSGWSELTSFRRTDGSVTYLMVEFLGFFGGGLDRFVTATFTADGDFDGGHWIATTKEGGDFQYAYAHDGRVLVGRSSDRERGTVTTRVPCTPQHVPVGFFGPLESLIIERFDRDGPDTQTIAAVGVEDGHHEAIDVEIERMGKETIAVAAGSYETTRFRSRRYGDTMHWITDDGLLVRWESEGGSLHWELEREPGPFVMQDRPNAAATGRYDIEDDGGKALGHVSWQILDNGDGLALESEGGDDRHVSTLSANLDRKGGLARAVEWVRPASEASGAALIATFVHRANAYLLRLTDGAFPYLQHIELDGPRAYLPLGLPVAAALWLRGEAREAGVERGRALTTSHRSPVGSLFRRAATLVYTPLEGRESAHRFDVRYPAGWLTMELRFDTDDHFIPHHATATTRRGLVHYRLTDLAISDPGIFGTR